jgi:hypothetical protein
MTLNMTKEVTRYDALGWLTAIEVGVLAGFVYGYVPMKDNIETITFTHRDNDPANSSYDALYRRVEKVDAIAGTTTRYYYDEQRAGKRGLRDWGGWV